MRHLIALPIPKHSLIGYLAVALLATTGIAVSPASATHANGETTANLLLPIPLAGATTGSSTTLATVQMGKHDGQFNLFWELFSFDTRTARFTLITPPGVADNGGLMVASNNTSTTALVGFGASQDLTFSPLALTTSSGKTWSEGGLRTTLRPVPSALGLSTSGADLALVGGNSPAVLRRAGSLTNWKTLVTPSTLAKTTAGYRCDVGALSAVAVRDDGAPLIGSSCQRPGVVGIFDRSSDTWHLANIALPSALASDTFSVERLGTNSGLLGATRNAASAIVATWQQHVGMPWLLSPPLALHGTDQVIASGTGSGTTQFVLVRSDGTTHAEMISGPGDDWRRLPSLPTGTATLAITPNGQIDALIVKDTRLSVWTLATVTKRWTLHQSINVPIAFGSSS